MNKIKRGRKEAACTWGREGEGRVHDDDGGADRTDRRTDEFALQHGAATTTTSSSSSSPFQRKRTSQAAVPGAKVRAAQSPTACIMQGGGDEHGSAIHGSTERASER